MSTPPHSLTRDSVGAEGSRRNDQMLPWQIQGGLFLLVASSCFSDNLVLHNDKLCWLIVTCSLFLLLFAPGSSRHSLTIDGRTDGISKNSRRSNNSTTWLIIMVAVLPWLYSAPRLDAPSLSINIWLEATQPLGNTQRYDYK